MVSQARAAFQQGGRMIFVNPPAFLDRHTDFEVALPVNLGYLERASMPVGWSAGIVDMMLEEKEGESGFAALIRAVLDEDVRCVGISVHTVRTGETALAVARQIRKLRPDVLILAGGVHATFSPKELLSHGVIDVVLRGYATAPLRDLLRGDIPIEAIAGAVTPDNCNRFTSAPHPSPDDFPAPSLQFLQAHRYLAWTKAYSLLTHTGCGFACNFCTAVLPGPYPKQEVYRPIQTLISEMLQARDCGFTEFFMSANTFTSDREWCMAFCQELESVSALKGIEWTCMTRIELVDREICLALQRAGCRNIAFGVESAGVAQWKSLKKGGFSETRIHQAFQVCREVGLDTTAYVILGAPEQTLETYRETVDLIRKLCPTYVVASFFQPFPGTPYGTSPESYGLSEIEPPQQWGFHEHPVCRTKAFTKPELLDAQAELYLYGLRADEPLESRLEVTLDAAAANEEMVVAASYLNEGATIRSTLEAVTEDFGYRGRLIVLYWLSALIRGGRATTLQSSLYDYA